MRIIVYANRQQFIIRYDLSFVNELYLNKGLQLYIIRKITGKWKKQLRVIFIVPALYFHLFHSLGNVFLATDCSVGLRGAKFKKHSAIYFGLSWSLLRPTAVDCISAPKGTLNVKNAGVVCLEHYIRLTVIMIDRCEIVKAQKCRYMNYFEEKIWSIWNLSVE